MKLPLFSLQMSIFIHFVLVVIIFIPKFNSSEFESQEIVDFDIKNDSVSHSESLPKNSRSRVEKKESLSSLSEELKVETDEFAGDFQVVEGAVTEEPKIISEPPLKQRTEEARKHGYTGTAKLKILIDQEGYVQEVQLMNSLSYGLNERAIELAKQVRLSPARINGKPIPVLRDFTITFKATD